MGPYAGPRTPAAALLTRAPDARTDEMAAAHIRRCPTCGEELVLEMDPAAPPDAQAVVLLADPPFRFVCPSPDCS